MYRKLILAILAAGCLFGQARALSMPARPGPERLVNDFAGVIPQWQADSLEYALVAFDDSTSNQIAIVTVTDLDGMEVAEYAVRLANEWGIGSSRNNGVLILLKPRGFTDNYIDVSIQVGRGLEGAIPDAYAARIIRNIMGPHLSGNEYVPALSKACAELMALASGEISEPRDNSGDDSAYIALAIFVFVILIVVVLTVNSKGNGGSTGGSNGGGGGGPIIFGSGFGSSSGSGSFGGFGSGGGSFGGFGGGSFGGGGASGRF